MAQGDLTSKFSDIIDQINELNKNGNISEYKKKNFLTDSLNSAIDSVNSKKEDYKLDLKQETLGKYFKRISKIVSDDIKKSKDFKKEQKVLSEKISEYREKEHKFSKSGNKKLAKLLKDRRGQLEAAKKMAEIQKKIEKETAKAAGGMAKYGKGGHPLAMIAIFVGDKLLSAAKAILNAAISVVKFLIPKNFDILAPYKWYLKFQTLSGKISADAGLTASESGTFLGSLPNIMLGVLTVGGELEDIAKVFSKFSSVTNKNNLFSKEEYTRIIELGLGTALGTEGAAEFVGNFNNLGYSVDETLDFTEYVRDKAMAINLNQSKILNSVNKTTVALTGFGITMGLKGMVNLVTKTEKLRLDVSKSVKNFADAFKNPEIAVDVAAKAKLLGGKFAFYFGDPFVLMGKSILEPEQLTADLIESLKDKAFKGKNGFEISPADREIIRNLASALGQDSEELFNVAIEQGKDLDKIKALEKRGIFELNIGEEKSELLKNLMTLNEDGSYNIRLSNGVTQRLSEIPSNVSILKTINQERKNKESAIMRKNLAERINMVVDRFMIGFSEVFVVLDKYFTSNNTIQNLDNLVKSYSDGLVKFITGGFDGEWGKIMKRATSVVNSMLDKLLYVWTDPQKGFTKILSDSIDIIQPYIIKHLLKPLEFYSGKLIYYIGKVIQEKVGVGGQSLMKSGLEIQSEGLMGAGQMFQDKYLNGLNNDIEAYNKDYSSADPTGKLVKMGFTTVEGVGRKKLKRVMVKKITQSGAKGIAKSMLKTGAKQVLKKIPLLGLAIGIFDSACYAIEGKWGQAGLALGGGIASTVPGIGTAIAVATDVTNLAIDATQDYSVDEVNVNDAIITKEGKLTKGKKGYALDYINQLTNNNIGYNSNQFNIVLKGKIKNIYRMGYTNDNSVDETVILSSKMILQQMINNLS